MDDFFNVCSIRGGKILNRFVFCEKRRGNEINSRIGALCRKTGCDNELKRIVRVEGANAVGKFFFKSLHCRKGSFFFCHGIISFGTNGLIISQNRLKINIIF
jgi:hypothetical protein